MVWLDMPNQGRFCLATLDIVSWTIGSEKVVFIIKIPATGLSTMRLLIAGSTQNKCTKVKQTAVTATHLII